MSHNLLFIMSLSGSIILLLYILVYPFAQRYFSLAWRYCILKISIALYLIPFSVILLKIRIILLRLFPEIGDNITIDFMNTKYAFCIDENFLYVSSKVKEMFILILGIGLVSSIIIFLHVVRYWKVSKMCLKYSYLPIEKGPKKIFNTVKSELNLNRQIKLLCSRYCSTPATIGIFSPVVIIPPWKEEMKDNILYQDIIKHELIHIKHRDVFIKFLGMIVIAVHWFNPLTYILYYEITNISEIYCDSIVLNGKDEKERKLYAELLLTLATEKYRANSGFAVGIIGRNNKMAFKRRILEMKRNRKNKTALSIIAMMLICMLGGITTCAYDAPASITTENEISFLEHSSDFQFIAGELDLEIETVPTDYFFVDDVGNIYDLNSKENNSRKSCKHKYTSGTTVLHEKNANGGCTCTYYEAWRCSVCGSIKINKKLKTVTYEKCPH